MKGFAVLLLMIVILVPAALHAQPHDMKASEGRAEGRRPLNTVSDSTS